MNASKPVIRAFNQIAPIMIQRYERYLPTAFDDTLTLLEKVNKLIENSNQVNGVVNDLIEQWNEVVEWVLNESLQQGIAEQLIKWKDDGTLDSIINESILGSKASIFLSKHSPSNPDETTYWYEDLGEPPVNFYDNPNKDGIIVSEDEPVQETAFWFDVE